MMQISAEHEGHVCISGAAEQVEAAGAGTGVECVAEVLDLLLDQMADEVGFGFKFGAGFHVTDNGDAAPRTVIVKIEVEFAGVEDLKDDDFVAPMMELAERGEDGIGVVEQIADKDDDRATLEARGELEESGGKIGCAGGRGVDEGVTDAEDVAGCGAGGYLVDDVVAEECEADAVALVEHEVCEAGGEALGVSVFRGDHGLA